MKSTYLIFLLLGSCFLGSCKRPSDDKDLKPAAIRITLKHKVRNVPVSPGNFQALNDSEQVQVNRLRYYLSNFKIRRADGTTWLPTRSYHLVQVNSQGNGQLVLGNIPAGSFNGLEFSFGVDSLQNSAVDYTSDLDPINGMAWDWETGYKFLLLEGRSKLGGAENALVWHVGFNSSYRTMRRDLQPKELKGGDTLSLEFSCALDSLFQKPNTLLPLARHRSIMFNRDTASQVADNFALGFIR